MTISPEAWGGIFLVYVLAGVPVLGASDNGARPKTFLRGSVALVAWERREKRGNRLLVWWNVGFFALIGAWYVSHHPLAQPVHVYLSAIVAVLPLFGAWFTLGMVGYHAQRREWGHAFGSGYVGLTLLGGALALITPAFGL